MCDKHLYPLSPITSPDHLIYLRQGLSLNIEYAHWLDELASEPWEPTYLCITHSSKVRDNVLPHLSSGDLNWGPHVCTSPLQTELSPKLRTNLSKDENVYI